MAPMRSFSERAVTLFFFQESVATIPSRPLAKGLLHNLSFRLVGLRLLILQGFLGTGIRGRRRNVGSNRGSVGSLWKTAGPLFRGEIFHPVVELLLEVIVHLLQIVDRDCHLFAGRAIRLFSGGDTYVYLVIVVGRIGNARDYVAGGKLAFLAVARDGEIAGNHERASRGIESGGYFFGGRTG